MNVNDCDDVISFIIKGLSPKMNPEWDKFLPPKLRTAHLNLGLNLKANYWIMSIIGVSWLLMIGWLPFMMGNFLHVQINSIIHPSQ